MTAVIYDGSFEGLLTAVFEIYEYNITDPAIYATEDAAPVLFGKPHVYDSLDSFSQVQQEEAKKAHSAMYSEEDKKWNYGQEITFKDPDGYDSRVDHFINFFESVRTGKKVFEDATFGLRAAAPALACNLSAELGKPVLWDAEKMKMV